MTVPEQQHAPSGQWADMSFARSWFEQDAWSEMLMLPREITCSLVAADAAERPGADAGPKRVADIGSGPGTFLAALLDAFPDAAGVWLDASNAMLEVARPTLSRYAGRVQFVVAPMTDLSAIGSGFDVIVSSRASHHLELPELNSYYTQAFRALCGGGWMINLDHTRVSPYWKHRFQSLRRQFLSPGHGQQHPHPAEIPTLDDHFAAAGAAGFGEITTPWRFFATCLIAARRPEFT